MTLQTSGSISFSQLATEFSDTAPHSMSEFYRDGSLVPSEEVLNVSGSNISTLSGTYAPKFQGGSTPNNLRVFQGRANYPTSNSGSADADRYLSNGNVFSEGEDGTCYPRFANQNNGTWTAPYAGTVNIICVGGGASTSYWGREGGDSGAGGGAVYATASVSSGAVLTWYAGGAGHRGSVGPHPGNMNRGGGGGGGTSRVTGTNSSGTSFTVRALGGQWSSFSGYFRGYGTAGLNITSTYTPTSINGQRRHEGGPAYATGGCTQVAAAQGNHGQWWGNGGRTVLSDWGNSGLNSIITSTTTWTGHTNGGYHYGSYTSLSFNTSTGSFTPGSGGWGQGGRKTDFSGGGGSVGAPGVVFIWMNPKSVGSLNSNVPTSGTISVQDFYGSRDV